MIFGKKLASASQFTIQITKMAMKFGSFPIGTQVWPRNSWPCLQKVRIGWYPNTVKELMCGSVSSLSKIPMEKAMVSSKIRTILVSLTHMLKVPPMAACSCVNDCQRDQFISKIPSAMRASFQIKKSVSHLIGRSKTKYMWSMALLKKQMAHFCKIFYMKKWEVITILLISLLDHAHCMRTKFRSS